jgi:hypothetical protein
MASMARSPRTIHSALIGGVPSSGRGMSGHQSAAPETHIWLTPQWLLRTLGRFDLDPCGAPFPRPWDTADTHYTAPLDDGLSLPWFDRIWLNPPYGDEAGAWLQRMTRHRRGTALIFARTETETFFGGVWEQADALLFLRGRLFFHHPNGRRARHNAGAPSVLCAYGPEDAEILYESGIDGAFVALTRPVMIHVAIACEAPVPVWRDIVTEAIRELGGTARLRDIYAALESHPRVAANAHWREKIRQTVARIGVPRVGAGQYALAV